MGSREQVRAIARAVTEQRTCVNHERWLSHDRSREEQQSTPNRQFCFEQTAIAGSRSSVKRGKRIMQSAPRHEWEAHRSRTSEQHSTEEWARRRGAQSRRSNKVKRPRSSSNRRVSTGCAEAVGGASDGAGEGGNGAGGGGDGAAIGGGSRNSGSIV